MHFEYTSDPMEYFVVAVYWVSLWIFEKNMITAEKCLMTSPNN